MSSASSSMSAALGGPKAATGGAVLAATAAGCAAALEALLPPPDFLEWLRGGWAVDAVAAFAAALACRANKNTRVSEAVALDPCQTVDAQHTAKTRSSGQGRARPLTVQGAGCGGGVGRGAEAAGCCGAAGAVRAAEGGAAQEAPGPARQTKERVPDRQGEGETLGVTRSLARPAAGRPSAHSERRWDGAERGRGLFPICPGPLAKGAPRGEGEEGQPV